MIYLFGIVLCFTFLATLNFWHKTRGEREEAAKKRAAVKALSKTCSKGWHQFGMWKLSTGGYFQYRYCTQCGLRDRRIA